MSADPFAGLQPELLWQHFAAFTKIARPSGQEEAARAYVEEWARSKGYELEKDATGNLCVHVPGSPGKEDAPVVVLQGHLDMVCERDSDSPYDAQQGRLKVVRDGEWIRAEGTTLGADNAIGVAAGMAAADDSSLVHGPLDLLMTIDEETGMSGAIGLDAGMVRGRVMLNLDSEEDGTLYVGCAGGCDTKMALTFVREVAPEGSVFVRLALAGLRGGHSGLDINNNRLNSIRALARILQHASEKVSLRLHAIEGGSMRNAIPREASAVLALAEGDRNALEAAAEDMRALLATQYAGLDDGLSVSIEPVSAPGKVFSAVDSARVLSLLRAIPSGVVAMSQDIDNLVETSTNLGVLTTDGDTLRIICCSRSSVAPALRDVLDTLQAVGILAGAEVVEHGGYPGWKPDMESRVLRIAREASQRLFGENPAVMAIHAGLECGLLGERIPGMDMISFGPDIRSAHAPGERVNIRTVERFWSLLGAVLAELAA